MPINFIYQSLINNYQNKNLSTKESKFILPEFIETETSYPFVRRIIHTTYSMTPKRIIWSEDMGPKNYFQCIVEETTVTPTEPPVTPTEPPVTPTETTVTPTEPPVTPLVLNNYNPPL